MATGLPVYLPSSLALCIPMRCRSFIIESSSSAKSAHIDIIAFQTGVVVSMLCCWCKKLEGKIEYVLDDGSRVDCLTDQYAIEFDFAKKWAEAIGQSLYYAEKTGKQPGIILIIPTEKDMRHMEKIKKVIGAKKLNIKLWSIKPDALN